MATFIQVKGSERWRRQTKNQTSVKTRVINRNTSSRVAIKLSVYIGRPSKWGNPYPLIRESRRETVIRMYEHYIATRLIKGEITQDDFSEFDGKNLSCFCYPKACHGDILVKLYYMTHEERLKWANEICTVHGGMEPPRKGS